MQVLIVLSACLAACSALSVGVRSSIFDCPTVNVTEDFDIQAFSGVWYQQYYSLGSEMSQGYSYCGVGTWTQVDDATMFMVNKQKGILSIWQSIEGYGVLEDTTIGNFTTTYSTIWFNYQCPPTNPFQPSANHNRLCCPPHTYLNITDKSLS